ncbi:MAG: hypothetical protein HIU91_07410 [Acidobacteria bacterium]|nr:hypothetical protein [Acidobacteriota bacterium]
MLKIYRSFVAVFAVWLLGWMWVSWPAMQDDAFIHLRYAANLVHDHMISYNGVHQDYGTSSLLYVWLLACLYRPFASPVLPRAVSTFFHLVLFGGLVWGLAKRLRPAPKLAWMFALLLLGILATPMSVRWLDDGMETSLTLCMVALAAFLTSKLCHRPEGTWRESAVLFLLGFIATLTRVEYLLLFGIVSATLFFAPSARPAYTDLSTTNVNRWDSRFLRRCVSPLAGSLIAASIIFFTMHSLVPDTAVAKAGGFSGWLGTLDATLSVFESSLSLGALFVIFWLLTLVAIVAFKRRMTLPILLVNSLFPITICLAAIRGQEVQGVRYFIWTLLYPVLWNTLEWRWSTPTDAVFPAKLFRLCAYGVALLLLVLQPIESKLLYREFRLRKESLMALRMQHLETLRPLKLVAYDIGYIGYFTGSQVCDMAGLVNGRERALLSAAQRVRICADEDPQLAFLTKSGIGTLNNDLSLKDWSVCSAYDLANLRSSDVHYLIAAPGVAAEVCSAADGTPHPVAPLLQP